MTTDFNYNNKTIDSSGPIKPSGTDQPGDPRTRVDFYSDIKSIPNPYIGMIVTVKMDETNQNKMTDYKVISLKPNALGIANSVIDRVQRYIDYLGVSTGGSVDLSGYATKDELNSKANTSDIPTNTSELYNDSGFLTSIPSEYITETEMNEAIANISSGGSVSQEDINTAVNNYFTEHQVTGGATAEQAAQIQANKTAIGDANSGLIKEVNNIKNTELQNLNTAIQTLETLVGVDETLGDKSGLPSGDANVIASINRIDRKTTTGNGLTTEQAQQLQTAYEHSQSTHVTFDDLLNIDVKEVGKKIITGEYSKIVLMGDSITDGYGGTGYNGSQSASISTNTDGYCWANVFKKYLSEKYSISVSNTGMYGSVISEQMNKINEIITDDTDLVILLTGTNNRNSSSTFDNYKSNLSTHINSLLAKNVDLLVINNIPSTLNDENNKYATMRDIADVVIKNTYGNVKSFSMYDEFINYCENNNISLSTLFYDHIHPNDDGYLIMFKLLCKNIGLPLSPYDDFSQSSSWWNGSTSTEVYGNIITNTTSLTIDEGSTTTTFTVKLSQAPTSTQQVSLTSNNSDVTLSPNSLSFSSSDYNVTQTVTVTVLEDDDKLNDSAIITLSSNNVTNKTINVTVNDNDNTDEIIYSKNSNINITDTGATFTSSTENFDWFILPSSNSKIKITSATGEFWIVLAGDSTKCLASIIYDGNTQAPNCVTYKVYESGTGTNKQIAGSIFNGLDLIDYLEYSYSGNIITCTNGTATKTYDISSVVSEFGTPRLGLMCEKKRMPITINYTIE